MKTSMQNKEKMNQIIAKALADEAFKTELKKHPREVLAKHGIQVPANVKLEILENTDNFKYLVLPGLNAASIAAGDCVFSCYPSLTN